MRTAILFFILITFCLSENLFISVDPKTQHYVDTLGRVRLFHGVNVVYKPFPYVPPITTGFDANNSFSEIDMDNLVKWGMNVVRFE